MVRGIALLYLRFTHPPKKLWYHFEPFVTDPTPITLPNASEQMTFGDWVNDLMTEQNYYGTGKHYYLQFILIY